MTAGDLYNTGWRQGSVFLAKLTASSLDVGDKPNEVAVRSLDHGRWVVCTQDCDLRSSPLESSKTLVEVRPVFDEEPPADWGIRSNKIRLTYDLYVEAGALRLHLTPALLHRYAERRSDPLADHRATAFKTWLGLRYDRPAVPEALVPAAREVAKRCGAKGGRETALRVHDVFMQFNEDQDPPRVALFAVVVGDEDREPGRVWLAEAATRVQSDVCVVAHIDVGTKAEVPLELVETSYSADLSQLTWGGEIPTGAE